MANLEFEVIRAFICVIALAVDVLAQISSFRMFGSKHLLRSQIIGFFVGGLAFCFIYFIFFQEKSLIEFGTLSIGYSALVYGYFHFLNLGETARRVRIMREIFSAGEKGLSYEEITKSYSSAELIEKRLNRLLKTNQIKKQNGFYFIQDKTLLNISKFILFLKKLILGQTLDFNSINPLKAKGEK